MRLYFHHLSLFIYTIIFYRDIYYYYYTVRAGCFLDFEIWTTCAISGISMPVCSFFYFFSGRKHNLLITVLINSTIVEIRKSKSFYFHLILIISSSFSLPVVQTLNRNKYLVYYLIILCWFTIHVIMAMNQTVPISSGTISYINIPAYLS